MGNSEKTKRKASKPLEKTNKRAKKDVVDEGLTAAEKGDLKKVISLHNKLLNNAEKVGMFKKGNKNESDDEDRPSLKIPKSLKSLECADIIKKPTRKNRMLFSFPGYFKLNMSEPSCSIGCVRLDTSSPVLYLNFPQGRLKLLGTYAYIEDHMLTFQIQKKKALICQDSFQKIAVFSKLSWIGTQEENPEEIKLPIPDIIMKQINGEGIDSEVENIEEEQDDDDNNNEEVSEDDFKYVPKPKKTTRTAVEDSPQVFDVLDSPLDSPIKNKQPFGEITKKTNNAVNSPLSRTLIRKRSSSKITSYFIGSDDDDE